MLMQWFPVTMWTRACDTEQVGVEIEHTLTQLEEEEISKLGDPLYAILLTAVKVEGGSNFHKKKSKHPNLNDTRLYW